MNTEEISFAHKALDELETSNKQIKELKAEIANLRKENEELKAELSAFKEGIKPENAGKPVPVLGHYYCGCCKTTYPEGWPMQDDDYCQFCSDSEADLCQNEEGE